MCKKLLLVAVLGVAAFAALRGTKFFGYAKQEIESARTWVEDQVPVEKEIARLRREVTSLEKDRAKVADLLAKEIVDVRYLREDVESLRAVVKREDDELRERGAQLKSEVKAPNAKVKYGRSFVTAAEAKEMLKADVARHVVKTTSLHNQEKALAMREQNKETLEKQLDTLKRQKDDLTTQIDAFEANFRALQLEQMQSKYQTDSTRLAEIKDSLRNLQKKLDVERVKLNLTPRVQEEAPAGSASAESVDEILAPLDGKKGEKVSKTN